MHVQEPDFFQFDDHSPDKKLPIKTLMEEVKPICMVKYGFYSWDISKLLSISGILD